MRGLSRTLGWLLVCAAPSLAQDPAKDLKSKDPLVRLAALQQLEDGTGAPDAKLDKLLVQALEDDDWEVAECAAKVLGSRSDKLAQKALLEFSLEAPCGKLRRAAARALARGPADAAAEELLDMARGKTALLACEALAELGPACDHEPKLAALEKLLAGKDVSLHAPAARALLALARESRQQWSARLLDAEQVEIAAAALEALVPRMQVSDVEALLLFLQQPLDETLERRAIAALQAVPSPTDDAARSVFERALLAASERAAQGSGNPRGRLQLAHLDGALAAAPHPSVSRELLLELLRGALRDASDEVRSAAASGIALAVALRPEERSEELDLLHAVARKDSSARVRRNALGVLGRLELNAAERAQSDALCIELLERDADSGVREDAAVGLGRAGLEAGLVPLARALEREALGHWNVAVCSAVSLGKTRSPAALPALDALSRHTDWRLRGAAVVGLGELRQGAAVPLLIEALADPEPLVRRSALEPLQNLSRRKEGADQAFWRSWWKDNAARARFEDSEQLERRRKELGYSSASPDAIYAGQDTLVLQSRGDHIEQLLTTLGIAHRLTMASKVAQSELHPSAVFVSNCTGEVEAADIERLAWFVRVGGYFFGSCWSLHETLERLEQAGGAGLSMRKLETQDEVLDRVPAFAAGKSPYLDAVFAGESKPFYELQGAHLIEVLDRERVEVLIDSPACAQRWGGGNLAAWMRLGHGVALDSVNHFDVQGLELATELGSPEERMAFAVDHMGLGWEQLRELRKEPFWAKSQEAAKRVQDLSVFQLVTNFVRKKRLDGL